MIEFVNVSKTYKNINSASVQALNDVSFAINDGEFVAIVGRSGSGKSTLLNIMGLLDVPNCGYVKINGRDVNKLSEVNMAEIRNKNIGFVFQSYYLDPYFTVFENIALPLIVAGVVKSERKKAVEDALVLLGLAEQGRKYPKELSGGEMQRVAIARAIVMKPLIILADEPTGNLDSENGQAIIEILKNFANLGKTVVMVTHNAEDAKVADRIIRLKDGAVAVDC